MTLLNQEEDALIPCFGKNARICGTVNVVGGGDVEMVEVQVSMCGILSFGMGHGLLFSLRAI